MKVQDLFIGALVKYDDEIVIVRGIDNVTGRSHIDIKVYNGGYFTTVTIDKLQPIPLTDEILTTNGFTKTTDTEEELGITKETFTLIERIECFLPHDVAIIIEKDPLYDGVDEQYYYFHDLGLCYVHELQALIRLYGYFKKEIIII